MLPTPLINAGFVDGSDNRKNFLESVVACDRCFTSVNLFSSLLQQKVYACGTILSTYINFPVDLRGVHLEKGQFLFCQTGNIIATVWIDKKIVREADPRIQGNTKLFFSSE